MTYFEFNEKFPTNGSILQHFRTIRYRNGLVCPHCGSTQKVRTRTDQPKLCNCNRCHNTFSIFTGTIFEKSSTDLTKWFYAVHLFMNAKKGISALQLQREIGTAYKTAWRMLKQIRTAMGNENLTKSFELIVEVDETYVGGKPRKENNNLQFTTPKPKDTSTTGRGTKKTPVISVKERGTGRVYARVALPNEEGKKLTGNQLLKVISAVTKPNTVVMTDDFKGYNIMNHEKTNPEKFTHISVCHSLGEFSAGKGLHTNGIESFWAILKRAIIGSYHHVSTKYLQSYVNECCFRQNNQSETAFDKLLIQSVLSA